MVSRKNRPLVHTLTPTQKPQTTLHPIIQPNKPNQTAKEARAVEGQRGGNKEEESLEGVDPAKRAKIEAARKAKAEKAAAKVRVWGVWV